jgi:hypothetical protein
MLNWPNYGNDIYLNLVELNEAQREKELVKAKEQTRRFIYFIQKDLGFKNLGLADDEFPTADRLALIPYHREGRRVKGLVRFTMRHIAEPFTYGDPLYRTGISVGDYPIDHHHKKNLSAPQHLEFYPVPSFNVPLGALIPQGADNIIIAEKAISVSNVANGTTRLQPCVLLTGQAAGALAALSIKAQANPKNIPVRLVQNELLKAKAYIMPYITVQSVLHIAGKLNKNWHNKLALNASEEHEKIFERKWAEWGLNDFDANRPITRLELAVLLHNTIDPFSMKAVSHKGAFIQ